MINCPKTVNLGYMKLGIVFDKRRLPEKEDGMFIPEEQLVVISEKLSPRDTVNTVLHELKHVMFVLGHLKEEDGEEHMVTVLANLETELFARNRRLLQWVQQELARPQ